MLLRRRPEGYNSFSNVEVIGRKPEKRAETLFAFVLLSVLFLGSLIFFAKFPESPAPQQIITEQSAPSKYTGLDYITLFEQQSYEWFKQTFNVDLPKRRSEFGKAGSFYDCEELTNWNSNDCKRFDVLSESLLDINQKDFIGSLRGIYDPNTSGKEILMNTLNFGPTSMQHFESFANSRKLETTDGFKISGGSGVGFHVHCGSKLLISFGGGGGGTLFKTQDGRYVSTSGGGGGIQAFDGAIELLVGGGTGLDSSKSSNPSLDSVANRKLLLEHMPHIVEEVNRCPVDMIHFYGGGAGVMTLSTTKNEANYLHRYFTFGFEYGRNFGESLSVPSDIADRNVKESYCDYFIEDFRPECWKQNAQHPGQINI